MYLLAIGTFNFHFSFLVVVQRVSHMPVLFGKVWIMFYLQTKFNMV